MFTNITYTVFGWKYHVTLNPKVRSIRNFPMQANGAEIMRLAVCLGVENGITICCPVHDAVLIMAPLDRLDSDIARMRAYMEQASELVLEVSSSGPNSSRCVTQIGTWTKSAVGNSGMS